MIKYFTCINYFVKEVICQSIIFEINGKLTALASKIRFAYNGSGICEGTALKTVSRIYAQKLIVAQLFNSFRLPCFCKYLVTSSFILIRHSHLFSTLYFFVQEIISGKRITVGKSQYAMDGICSGKYFALTTRKAVAEAM